MAEIGVKAIARRTSRSSRAWCVANSRQPRNEDDIVRPSPKKGSAMMQLYWSPRSRSFSSLWLFEETGQPYERVLTDISTGAQRKLEYLAINPMGKVPALKDGEATLAEAAAICAYVAERYPEAKLAPPLTMFVADSRRQSSVSRWRAPNVVQTHDVAQITIHNNVSFQISRARCCPSRDSALFGPNDSGIAACY